MPIDTTMIDAAFDAAAASAASLGDAVVYIPPTPVEGITDGSTQTIETDVVTYSPDGVNIETGFQIVANIQAGGSSFNRTHITLPMPNTTSWMDNYSARPDVKTASSIAYGNNFLASQGFDSGDIENVNNLYLSILSANGGDPSALETTNPILSSVYNWILGIQTQASNSDFSFTSAPYTLNQVETENPTL